MDGPLLLGDPSNTIQNLEVVALELEQAIADTRKRTADLTAQIDQPFEYCEQLAFLTRRQQEIEEKLDLTRNQAPAQLDAASSAN